MLYCISTVLYVYNIETNNTLEIAIYGKGGREDSNFNTLRQVDAKGTQRVDTGSSWMKIENFRNKKPWLNLQSLTVG